MIVGPPVRSSDGTAVKVELLAGGQGAAVFRITAPAAPGSTVVEVTIDGTRVPIRPRLFFSLNEKQPAADLQAADDVRGQVSWS